MESPPVYAPAAAFATVPPHVRLNHVSGPTPAFEAGEFSLVMVGHNWKLRG